MTLAQQMIDDVTDVFLNTEDFAVQVIRYVGGERTGKAVRMPGIITWHPTSTEYSGGRATERTGELMIAAGQNVTVTDSFLIGSDRVQVQTVGPEQNGWQAIGVLQRRSETKGAKPVSTGIR